MKKSRLELVEEFLSAKNNEVYDVLGLMNSLEMYFKKYDKRLVPFLKTYSLVTETVIDRQVSEDYFDDVDSLSDLDIHFASLYFKPLKKHLKSKKNYKPWRKYFEYSSRADRIEFLNMLLGINSHINGDLPVSLYKTGYTKRKDFLRINDLLKKEISEIMWYLATRKFDLMGLAGVFFREFFVNEFTKIVVKWRDDAWKNSNKLNSKNFDKKVKEIYEKTEKAAKEMIEIFEELYSLRHLKQIIPRLEKVRVRV
ncbi:MAG: DUF5995 family protein [Candidatus Pacearchaeota archaeon]